ncbi:MAG TPA: hypothetical protein VEI06_07470 [Gemmatimonadaceae bacterium]|nr:hypothetical protein [Gemmatimonadaceae bacterium]
MTFDFDDGSSYDADPEDMEILAERYGQSVLDLQSTDFARLRERLREVVDHYFRNGAWPSKMDGILVDPDGTPDYENPDFYFEHWSEWPESGIRFGKWQIVGAPTKAQIAAAVLYQSSRSLYLQRALNRAAEKSGAKAPKVVTPEQFVKEAETRDDD